MDPRLFEIGTAFAALTLVGWSIASFLNGTASATGSLIREALSDLLGSVRSSTSLTRSELAEVTLYAAIVVAIAGAMAEISLGLAAAGVLLVFARRSVVRLMAQENRLMAVAGSFTTDLMIGVFLPLALAQLLMGQLYLGAVLGLVIVTLSWPAGGSRPTGRWRPAWQSA